MLQNYQKYAHEEISSAHMVDQSPCSMVDPLQNTHVSIDINNSMQLQQMGLKRVQIEGFRVQDQDGNL